MRHWPAWKKEGVQVDERTEEYDYGKFGWLMDPEVNRIELWEPKSVQLASAPEQCAPTT